MKAPNWNKICKGCWLKEEIGTCENFCRKVILTIWKMNKKGVRYEESRNERSKVRV